MATIDEQVKNLNEQRMKAWEAQKTVLDRALGEGRTLTQEEIEQGNRIDADMRRIEGTRDALLRSAPVENEIRNINEEFARVSTPVERESQANAQEREIAEFFSAAPSHNRRVLDVDLGPAAYAYKLYRQGARGNDLIQEMRLLATDTGASGGSLTVPTTVSTQIYAYMTAAVAMRRIGSTIITTDSGNSMKFPRVATHGIGTQIATQNTAIAGTDPVLGVMTLDAYDFGQLTAISRDMLQDSGVDVLGFVAQNIGRALGQVTATGYVTGSGSSTIQGVEGALVGAGTVSSGGSLFAFPAGLALEKLIDVQYSIADSYRNGSVAWLMNSATGATIRKIRDGAGGTSGQFVWVPSPTVGAIGGQPDTFLGDPVYFDTNVATAGSNNKVVYYGDWSAYWIRDVGGFTLDRSDDLYFDKAQSAFRGIIRTDGDVIDTAALTVLRQNV